jgi:hypothetical protein
MAMNRITPRQRLDRLPAAAWAAGALGALAALFAFGTNAAAAVLMVLAAAAAYWASARGQALTSRRAPISRTWSRRTRALA